MNYKSTNTDGIDEAVKTVFLGCGCSLVLLGVAAVVFASALFMWIISNA